MLQFMVLGWLGLCVLPATQEPVEARKLVSADGQRDDVAGWSVAMSGNRALIGAWGDDDQGPASGSAYVFERDASGGWRQAVKLLASDGEELYYFGLAVALEGDLALMGAPRADDPVDYTGAVYVFERDALGVWHERARLESGLAGEAFGYDVDLHGDRAVIGASGGLHGDIPGSVFVYERDALGHWSQVARMEASDGVPRNYLGQSVTQSGDRILVGAQGDKEQGFSTGAAYLYERDAGGNWLERAKLRAADAAATSHFGSHVLLSGERAFVAAIAADGRSTDSGAVYVFERAASGEWLQTTRLIASDGERNDSFGSALALSGRRLLVGAYRDNLGVPFGPGFDAGTVYVFDELDGGSWHETGKLAAHDAANYDQFGAALAFDGDHALIGAISAAGGSGATYLFDFEPLSSDVERLSVGSGGVQTLELDAGRSMAGLDYQLLASLSGTEPGLALPFGFVLPLNPDPYFALMLSHSPKIPIAGAFGLLDANGSARATLSLPAGLPLALVGRTLHHAFVVFRPGERGVRFVSNPEALVFVP